MVESETSYAGWTPDALIERVKALEKELQDVQESFGLQKKDTEPDKPPPKKKPRTFDWSKYSTRFIALKFAYLGKRYNGFEHHANNKTPLPTVEETLWKALMKAHLICPQGDVSAKRNAIDWEGCDYSKCGRTDRGVSAFGQVIGLRVRSKRPPRLEEPVATNATEPSTVPTYEPLESESPLQNEPSTSEAFDDVKDELPYLQVLNSMLPSDIRMLAWCPSPPPNFSARFSCRERRYRYFFTQPAFVPAPEQPDFTHSTSNREAWLDIELMQSAAKRFEGLHDFRNFCKIDGSKQISDFRRRIYHAEIYELPSSEQPAAFVADLDPQKTSINNSTAPPHAFSTDPKTYVFDLRGSAFLWHQVRHIVAILFLVGQGLEPPETIDRLLDTAKCNEKPLYEMADDTPLVLWDCIFPDLESPTEANAGAHADIKSRTDSLRWIYLADEQTRGRFGPGGLLNETWRLWRGHKMDEVLAGSFMNLAARSGKVDSGDEGNVATAATGNADSQHKPVLETTETPTTHKYNGRRVFTGGNEATFKGKYVPVMQRQRQKSAEILNREYVEKHGVYTPKGSRAVDKASVETRTDHMDE